MDDPTFEPLDFQEDQDSQNAYTQSRTQYVQPPPPQNQYANVEMKNVQPPPHNPQVQYVQPPLSQNHHAERRIQFTHSPPPQNPHVEPYVQRPPRQNPHFEPQLQHFQRPPPQPKTTPTAEPQVQYVHPPPRSDAPVIYVQPPPQSGNTSPALWASSLYSCTDDPWNCCLTLWCPCVTFGQIAEIVDENSPSCMWSGGIHGVLCLVGLAGAVIIGWPWLTGFGWCYACTYRTKMRAKYNLAETPCADCLVHCCCEPSALCQEYKELKHRGYDPALGWTGNAEKQKQRGMTPPANQTMRK